MCLCSRVPVAMRGKGKAMRGKGKAMRGKGKHDASLTGRSS